MNCNRITDKYGKTYETDTLSDWYMALGFLFMNITDENCRIYVPKIQRVL